MRGCIPSKSRKPYETPKFSCIVVGFGGGSGIPLDIQIIAADRSEFRIGSITDDIIAIQQGITDNFFKLGLIPRQIAVRDLVWRNQNT